ncbi:MAG: hypothetical protein GY744_13900 [Gammaproteobacteria bacterium]|nr:hypothetical protein [Gammaproteobacteria bacterium]
MMSNNQTDQDIEELVNRKVRNRVARAVMKDIKLQVDDIEHQEQIEKEASKIIIPLLIALVLIVVLIAFGSDAISLLS